jgi:hypothetical protein
MSQSAVSQVFVLGEFFRLGYSGLWLSSRQRHSQLTVFGKLPLVVSGTKADRDLTPFLTPMMVRSVGLNWSPKDKVS